MKIIAVVTIITGFMFVIIYQNIQSKKLDKSIENISTEILQLSNENHNLLAQIENIKKDLKNYAVTPEVIGYIPTTKEDFIRIKNSTKSDY